MPKFNLYQSLHTTVVGPSGKAVEVQIRTQEMHRRAEFGVAAHWGYKEREPAEDLLWLQRMVDWQQETSDPGEFMEALKIDLEYDEVFVFTPKGKVITLAAGATPGRLRVRHPHRRRAPVHRRPRQRSSGTARLRAGVGRHGRDLHQQGRGRGPVAATGCSSCTRRRPRTKIRQWFSRERRVDADRLRPRGAGQGAAQGRPAGPEAGVVVVAARRRGGDALRRRRSAPCRHRREPRVGQGRRAAAPEGAAQRRGAAADHRHPAARARPSLRAPRHRRARRGPRRRDGAAVAVLHPGARRRDHGLRHPGPRRLGAPHRLRQRGRPGQPRRAGHRGGVGPRPARHVRGVGRGRGARPLAAPPRRRRTSSPSTT